MKPTLVLGIGNILLRDEGVGVHVSREVQAAGLPETAEALDGGTSGADLIEVIADRRKLIVVDAVKVDAEPGAVFRFGLDALLDQRRGTISMHEFGLLETLLMARQLGCLPKEIVIFGIEPKEMSPGLELSAEVAAVVPKVVGLVLDECVKEMKLPMP